MRRRRALFILIGAGTAVGVGFLAYRPFGVNSASLCRRLTDDFRRHIGPKDVSSLSVVGALDAMVSYFQEVKYHNDRSTPYGDALLFQYGVYNWGRGENFDFDLTRQVVFEPPSPAEADDFIIQLSLTSRFSPEPFRSFAPLTKWSVDFPKLSDFAAFIRGSGAYPLVLQQQRRTLDLHASAQ